jgi:hypothetical protein|tara:strand:+ start:2740 stop:4155 length:1416 start_codon:yes stop_codon:yes gene_type:complete
MPKINDFLKGFSNGLPGMKDYRHASRLYLDDNFKLFPKQKFLYHVVFDIDNTVPAKPFNPNELLEINMLVKRIDLPKYNMNYEEKQQYNKKTYIATRIGYDPINITFHDDHADTINAFWKEYYEYHIADPLVMSGVAQTKDTLYQKGENRPLQFGMDTPVQRQKPYLKSIQIFCLHKQRFTSFTLINPVISSFSHDSLDQTDGVGILENTMQILYESVLYDSGIIKTQNGRINNQDIPGFAEIHYDKEPSPLTVLGGGTTSIFGPGGIVDGVGSVIGDIGSGNFSLGTILRGINTYNNAKKIKAKDAVKEELKGIAKDGVREIGRIASNNTSAVGDFSITSPETIGLLATGTVASAVGLIDNKDAKNNTVIQNSQLNTVDFLSSTEAFNLVSNNSTVRDKVATGIYYKSVGSRQGLTISESDVEFQSLTDPEKNVYRINAINSITKLVSEGYILISRETNDVAIQTEKVNL